ncbi:MAG TPA: sulfite exporter TauE/SafE family protein [Beijerinckiaceae bacterium]|nr:sulfite exporter TauE/SafE family protein [Beijerinckiaceae bacterium]
MLLEGSQLWFGLVGALLIGLGKGGLGSGFGMLVVPVLSLTLDPRQAAALTLPILITSDFFAVYAYRGKAHTGHMRVLLTGAVIGIGLGALTFHLVSEPMLRLMMGLMALIYVVSRFLGLARPSDVPLPPDWGQGVTLGTISGFTSFTAHAGGPPVQVYMLPKGLDKQAFQATNVLLFTLINLIKVPPYLALGQFTGPVMLTSLMLMPVAAGGVFLGYRLHRWMPETLFFRIAVTLLFLTGLKLTWDGLGALLF